MNKFLEIKCLSEAEQADILKRLEDTIAIKKKEGILTEREIREIVEMKLHRILKTLPNGA